jgi:hypothetical protein
MVKSQEGKWVVPNPQIPRSFGLMNILFGSLMLLVAIGYGLAYVYAPTIQKMFQFTSIKAQQDKLKIERADKIAELKSKEAAAKTEEEKLDLADERKKLEAMPTPDLSALEELQDMNDYNEPRLAVFHILEISASIVLNVLMIVSGGGLMALREWARRLSIRVAQLKMLRWAAMAVTTMVMILPMTIERTQKAMPALEAQMLAQGAPVPAISMMTTFMRWSMMAGAVVMVFAALIACVYPALAWWYLSRPPARAACMK